MTPATASNPITEVRNINTFIDTPILALHKPTGRPVLLIAMGDSPNHSPVTKYVVDRQMRWGTEDEFEILDSRLQAPTLESLQSQLKLLSDVGSRATR